jgi:hypothetical protein
MIQGTHHQRDTKSQTDHRETYCSGIQHLVHREWRKQKEKQKQKAETGETKAPPPPEKEEVRKRNKIEISNLKPSSKGPFAQIKEPPETVCVMYCKS